MFVNKFSLHKVTHNGFSWRISGSRPRFLCKKSRGVLWRVAGDGGSVSTTRSSNWTPISAEAYSESCTYRGSCSVHLCQRNDPKRFFSNFGAQVQEILEGLDLQFSVHSGPSVMVR